MPTLLMLPPQTPTTREWAARVATVVPSLDVVVAEDAARAERVMPEADAATSRRPLSSKPGRKRFWISCAIEFSR